MLRTSVIIALLVAGAGIYGILSYAVQMRTREIGIRSALGANAGQLVSMVMGSAARLVALGLAVGVAGALARRPPLPAWPSADHAW